MDTLAEVEKIQVTSRAPSQRDINMAAEARGADFSASGFVSSPTV